MKTELQKSSLNLFSFYFPVSFQQPLRRSQGRSFTMFGEMAYESTQEQGTSIYPPLIPIIPFMSPYPGPVAGFPVFHHQNTAQTAYGPELSTSTIATGNTTLGYSYVPESTQNHCPYGNHSCPGKGWCSLLHPLHTFANSRSVPESMLETAPSLSTQNTISQPSTESNPSTRPGLELYESIMGRLSPSEQYVVEMKLEGKTFEEIRQGYKWKEFKSASSINAILNDLRARYDAISQLLPSKQYKSRSPKRPSNTNRVVGIVSDVYGQQNHQGLSRRDLEPYSTAE
jgi:hypothetical protein